MQTRFIPVSLFRSHLIAILRDINNNRNCYYLTRHGRELALLIPVEKSRLRTVKRILRLNDEEAYDMLSHLVKVVTSKEKLSEADLDLLS